MWLLLVQHLRVDGTHEEPAVVETILSPNRARVDRRARPCSNRCKVVSRVQWVLRAGVTWQDGSPSQGPWQTGHRRFQIRMRPGAQNPVLAMEPLMRTAIGKVSKPVV
jgi:transposase